jgi:hypothetical protein
VEGWESRVEVRALPSLYLDAELYENDRLTGNDYSVGVRVRVPFDISKLSRGRNPFEGAADGFMPERKRTPFASRLTDMVMRDPSIRTEVSEPTMTKSESTTASYIETNRTLVPIMTNVTFVRWENTNGVENGTWEHPYPTVSKGISNVLNHVVYVDSGTYLENVVLPTGLILWSSDYAVQGYGGRSLKHGAATIQGTNDQPYITILGDDVAVLGFHEKSVPNPTTIIYGYNVNRVTIESNYFEGLNGAIGVRLFADAIQDFQVSVKGNQFSTFVSGASIEVTNCRTAYVLLNDNYVSYGEGGIGVAVFATNNVHIDIRNNSMTTMGTPIVVNAQSVLGNVEVSIISNGARSVAYDGMDIFLRAGSNISLVGRGNGITDNSGFPGNPGNGLEVDAQANGSVSLDFSGRNSIYGSGGYDVTNGSPSAVLHVESNWWGTATPSAGQFSGPVDYTNWLVNPP